MRIFVDENIPLMTVKALQKTGHTVFDNRGSLLEGISDQELWSCAQRKKCLLITTDKGFISQRNEQHNGIIIVRLRQPNRLHIHDRVMKAIGQFTENEWPGKVIVMRDKVQSVWLARE